ncbi:phenylalanine--tRNA ligase subunit beta [Candidatus Sumerlaeota bacterium]|nr:phenylalanine--tRNA ligase subunit beta [Candidatus Sumerlaeota bacterium]
MRLSIRWLKNYLQTDLPVGKLLDAITACGLEVEERIDLGMLSGKLVVGELLNVEPIPGAEKIRLTAVQADEGQPLKIVCGAQNIKTGQKVPVARFGMTFPDGMVLKPRKIMGIEGQGMLCSARELGVSEEAEGIWILPEDVEVGAPYDALVEVGITPNRPDALSVIGVARDLVAKINTMKGFKASLRMPDLHVNESATEKVESAARVSVVAKEDSPRYTARVIKGVKVGPSPLWMQVALQSAGMRPINNIVDVTNFVMLELGHPLHAFDLDRLAGNQVIVRHATAGEVMQTLDGQELKLQQTDLVIADAQKPVALAGIMGGANSEISDGTTNILLESAYFRPQTIRATSKRLDKSTDSSYRFERGTDAKRLTASLNRAAQLIAETGGGTILRGVLEVVGALPEKGSIKVRVSRLNHILGLDLTATNITEVLTRLGFEVLRSDGEEMHVTVPSHRMDVSIEADIIEEIARIVGYDRIQEVPLTLPSANHPPSRIDTARATLSDAAVAQGFCQAVNFSFIGEADDALAGGAGELIRVKNPITSDQGVMRRSLLPGLLRNVVHNFNQSLDDVALFEIGHTYAFTEPKDARRGEKDLKPVAQETPFFAAILAGGGKRSWRDKEHEFDFFDIKGFAEYFLSSLGLQKYLTEPVTDIPWLHPGRAARFLVKGRIMVTFGEVHPSITRQLDIRRRVCYLEIPLDDAAAEMGGDVKARDIPRYPAVTRDIALIVDRGARSMDLERTIRKAGKELLAGVKLFDVYEGDKMEAGRKSLAFSLTYRAPDRTLKDQEVIDRHGEVLAALQKENNATLRG